MTGRMADRLVSSVSPKDRATATTMLDTAKQSTQPTLRNVSDCQDVTTDLRQECCVVLSLGLTQTFKINNTSFSRGVSRDERKICGACEECPDGGCEVPGPVVLTSGWY